MAKMKHHRPKKRAAPATGAGDHLPGASIGRLLVAGIALIALALAAGAALASLGMLWRLAAAVLIFAAALALCFKETIRSQGPIGVWIGIYLGILCTTATLGMEPELAETHLGGIVETRAVDAPERGATPLLRFKDGIILTDRMGRFTLYVSWRGQTTTYAYCVAPIVDRDWQAADPIPAWMAVVVKGGSICREDYLADTAKAWAGGQRDTVRIGPDDLEATARAVADAETRHNLASRQGAPAVRLAFDGFAALASGAEQDLQTRALWTVGLWGAGVAGVWLGGLLLCWRKSWRSA